MGVLSLPPTNSRPSIAFSLLKRLVRIVIWLLAKCERDFSNSVNGPFREPKYVWRAMRCVVSYASCNVILGDMFEDYRRILGERGKAHADSWLRDELVKTLLELMWRPAFINQFLRSIRRIASLDFIGRTSSVCGAEMGSPLAIDAFPYKPTLRIAFATLFVLCVPAFLFYRSSDLVTHPKDYPDNSDPSELTAQNVPPPPGSPQPLNRPTNARRDSMDSAPLRSKHDLSSSTKTASGEITLASDNFTRTGEVTRSVSDEKVTKIPRRGTPPLSLKLPDRGGNSLYDITLRDAGDNVVFSSTAKSVDGKKIRVEPSVQHLLQKLPKSKYYFSLSDKSNKDIPPLNFQFVLSPK
jgi:hypothetical protein